MCIPPRDISHLAPCDHEEADTRMILHVADVVNDGHQKVLLRTVDTDVVVLAVAAATNMDIQELWIAFEQGSIFGTFLPMRLHHHLVQVSLKLCLSFMPTQDVILFRLLALEEKRVNGILGRPMRK